MDNYSYFDDHLTRFLWPAGHGMLLKKRRKGSSKVRSVVAKMRAIRFHQSAPITRRRSSRYSPATADEPNAEHLGQGSGHVGQLLSSDDSVSEPEREGRPGEERVEAQLEDSQAG